MGDINDAYGGNEFNPNDHEPAGDFSPLPPGEYQVIIEKAEVLATKKTDGQYLKLQLAVVGEKFDGRKIFDNINLSNPNQKCVEIGLGQLAALGQALGLAAINDSAELIDKVVIAKIKIKTSEGREPDNEVRTYKPVIGAAGGQQAPASADKTQPGSGTTAAPEQKKAEAPKSATTSSKPPWER